MINYHLTKGCQTCVVKMLNMGYQYIYVIMFLVNSFLLKFKLLYLICQCSLPKHFTIMQKKQHIKCKQTNVLIKFLLHKAVPNFSP